MITDSDPQSINAIVYVFKTEPLTEFIVRNDLSECVGYPHS